MQSTNNPTQNGHYTTPTGAQPHTSAIASNAHSNTTYAQTGAKWDYVPSPNEKLLIQCLATGNDGAAAVFEKLSHKSFEDDLAARFYQAAQGLHELQKPINPETLAEACAQLAEAEASHKECQLWEYAAEIARGEELTLPKNFSRQNPAAVALKIADKIVENIAPPYEVFGFADLAKLPGPQWLIRGLLVEKTISVLTADTGSYKSFFALDMALCIATSRPFFGREVKRGPVVYVAAEGFYTMLDRAKAWADFHGVQLPQNFHILKVPVNVSDAATVQRFVEQFKELAPTFAVLDTLNQCAIGLNENANDEMARFMAGMAATGAALGAHVQTVHHNAMASGQFRGAGAIKNNVDTHISLDRPEGDETNTVFVRCEKQRGRPFDAFTLRGHEVTLPYCDEFGDEITSLVFEQTNETVEPKAAKYPNALKANKTRDALMKVFDECAIEGAAYGGVKVGFWKEAVEEANPTICETRTFWNHLKALKKTGTIRECGTHNSSPVFERTATTAKCSECSSALTG